MQNIKKAVSLQRFWRKVLQSEYKFGRLAQLVQSICLTSRGSAVRIRQRPHFFILVTFRAFSSAGSEHLPYKQRVGGSNPSTPTNLDRTFICSIFFFFCSICLWFIYFIRKIRILTMWGQPAIWRIDLNT